MSQKARYDGRAAVKLSSASGVPIPNNDADLHNVEFKLELEDLIDDFEREIKLPSEIQLVVVWDDTIKPSITDYQVVNIDYTADSERRLDGVDKVLHCKLQNRMLQMIVVQDLLRKPISAN